MISAATTQLSGTPDPLTLASTPSDYVEHHQVETESRNCTQTGSTNNLASETDIEWLYLCFGIRYSLVYMSIHINVPDISFTQKFQDGGRIPEFATENDTKVISAAVAMLQGTPDPPPPPSTLFDYRQHYPVQTGSRNST